MVVAVEVIASVAMAAVVAVMVQLHGRRCLSGRSAQLGGRGRGFLMATDTTAVTLVGVAVVVIDCVQGPGTGGRWHIAT